MSSKFEYRDLTAATRKIMLDEIAQDQAEGVLALSRCFNERGSRVYPALLVEAVREHDEEWLASQIDQARSFDATYVTSTGKTMKVRADAATVFAQSEFNRFYIRALCLQAMKDSNIRLKVYRTRHSQSPRPESEAKIGKIVDAHEIYDDLRKSVEASPTLGIAEVASGLSVEIHRNGT